MLRCDGVVAAGLIFVVAAQAVMAQDIDGVVESSRIHEIPHRSYS